MGSASSIASASTSTAFHVRSDADRGLGLLALDVAVWMSRKGESSIRCAPQEVRVFQRQEKNGRCGPVKGEVSGHVCRC